MNPFSLFQRGKNENVQENKNKKGHGIVDSMAFLMKRKNRSGSHLIYPFCQT